MMLPLQYGQLGFRMHAVQVSDAAFMAGASQSERNSTRTVHAYFNEPPRPACHAVHRRDIQMPISNQTASLPMYPHASPARGAC